MAAPVALSDMQTRTRELANMEVQFASDFISDDELRRRLNAALKQLYDKLIVARGQEYYASMTNFNTVPGQSDYPLPADFYEGLSVTATHGGWYNQMFTWEAQEWAVMQSVSVNTGSPIYALRYRYQGDNMVILPIPQGAFRIDLMYVPIMADLVLPADTFNGVNGWEEWACLTAAIGMLAKEESDPSALMAERSMIDMRIDKLAGNRDAGRASRIVDVRGDWYNYNWRLYQWNA